MRKWIQHASGGDPNFLPTRWDGWFQEHHRRRQPTSLLYSTRAFEQTCLWLEYQEHCFKYPVTTATKQCFTTVQFIYRKESQCFMSANDFLLCREFKIQLLWSLSQGQWIWKCVALCQSGFCRKWTEPNMWEKLCVCVLVNVCMFEWKITWPGHFLWLTAETEGLWVVSRLLLVIKRVSGRPARGKWKTHLTSAIRLQSCEMYELSLKDRSLELSNPIRICTMINTGTANPTIISASIFKWNQKGLFILPV